MGDSIGSSFGGYENPSRFLKDLKKNLVATIQLAEKVPTGEMNYLICSTYDDFVQQISIGSSQITSMMKNLADYWELPASTSNLFTESSNKAVVLQGVKSATKQLKERIDLTLDELVRLRDEQTASKGQVTGLSTQNLPGSPIVRTSKRTAGIMRPQIVHKWKIDNSPAPFEPKLPRKPNALRSLEHSLEDRLEDGLAPHPYQFELDVFEPPMERLSFAEPIPPKPLTDTPLLFVDQSEQLKTAIRELLETTEIAVDVEHHSFRTYLGITCLVQVSTRDKDYVFDTITLRDHLHELNEVFTKPDILKVFHGANLDIQWLQRDLGVYVVNMFDTGQAARALNLSRFSLSFLYQKYMGHSMDKTHQTSDWRLRPLPSDMLTYARLDTHDLLFLYDCVRNDLVQQDPTLRLLNTVYDQSKLVCLQRYEKKVLDENDFAFLLTKYAKSFSEQQKYGLKHILEWRDAVARELDESIGYVLPTKICVDLAEELPVTSDDLIKCVEYIPPVLKQKLHHVLELLKQARAFTGVVPLLATQNRFVTEERSETVQRKIRKPLTGNEFIKRYGGSFALKNRTSLVYDQQTKFSDLETSDSPSFQDIWTHFLTIKEEVADPISEDISEHFPSRPNMQISVPKELPVVEPEFKQPKKKASSGVQFSKAENSKHKTSSVRAHDASSLVGLNHTSKIQQHSTSAGENLHSQEHQSIESTITSASTPTAPAKRPAFDYATADYSKFSGAVNAGSAPTRQSQKKSQFRGAVKDPNNSFNKQRNMSATFPSQSFGKSRFRKPE